ncbi:hypothetical protein ACFSJY_02495 [Thalassotalea euphylliae]|uniref:hypothetical protein n=1 Tax=Thalassotalea euphylliae TaxID=1655234 RepID=UPI00362934C9
MDEHGEYQVELIGRIISCVLKGSFNKDGCKSYTEAVREKVSQLRGEPFAMLVDDLELEGGTPEAYQELDAYNRWLSTQPIKAKALVINSPMQKDIMLKRAPALKTQNIEFFTDKSLAMAWLTQQLN